MKLSLVFSSDSVQLNIDTTGKFWLYDKTLKMNLAMQVETEREAFLQAIKYHQRTMAETSCQLKALTAKVQRFVQDVNEREDS